LGQTTVLGKRVWNCQHKFRIVIGPLDLAQFRQLLPGGSAAGRLLAWVRNYAGLAFAWDVNLVLKRQQVPKLALGRSSHLGWSTWLISKTPENDDSQLRYTPTPASVGLAR
jgi:type VI secretion system protein ImpH